MGKLRHKIEWERLMGLQAWTAQELAPKLELDDLTTRRFLRIYWAARRLERKRFGVLWYYVVSRFTHPPDINYPCPYCRARMKVYSVKCGCEFQICTVNLAHSKFHYCADHKGKSAHRPKCKSCGRPYRKSEKLIGDRVETTFVKTCACDSHGCNPVDIGGE